MLADSFDPAVLNSLSEEFGEVVDVLSTHEMSLVSFWLEPLLRRIWRGDRTQVHGTNLGSTTNAVENPLAALLRLSLRIHLNLDDIPGGVRDDNTERIWHACCWIC